MAADEHGAEFREDLDRLSNCFPFREHPLFSAYCDIFGERLAGEVEFSFAPDKAHLELTLEGRGADFHDRIRSFLELDMMSTSHCDAYDRVNAFYPDVGTIFKVEFEKGAASAPVSIYYQTQISARLAARISSETGGSGFPVELFAEIGKQLDRKGIFMGIDLDAGSPDKPPALALFCLIAPRKVREGILSGLISVFEILDLGKIHKRTLEKYHTVLTGYIVNDLFVSFLFRDRLSRLVKIDYDRIGIPAAVKIMREMGTPDEELRRAVSVAQALDTRILSYFGMKYRDSDRLSFKLYFKRVYKDCSDDEAERFARFLESTVWRFDNGPAI